MADILAGMIIALLVPAGIKDGIKDADFDIPLTDTVDWSWPAATQAASLCTYISA